MKYLSDWKYALVLKDRDLSGSYPIYLSNKNPIQNSTCNNCIAFVSYDYKNEIENFEDKINNPLQFPSSLFVEVEEKLSFQLSQDTEGISPKIDIKPTVTKEEYIAKFKKLQNHIQQGDIYEINYCITFEAEDVFVNPYSLFVKLNSISDAPYACLAKFDSNYIISSSPELYLKKSNSELITKPIKGTAKRGLTIEDDEKLKVELHQNLKERTENVMIVDVCRNDLSRVAKKGTVTVDKLFEIESFKQVHQMVSTVKCELKNDTTFKSVIDATFPMASMTGAPKIRAMELIDEYEVYNRNAYSGTIGYINENGNFELSVLIRSIFYNEEKKYLSFTVGSAITSMANAEDEYEECLLKAKAMMQVLS